MIKKLICVTSLIILSFCAEAMINKSEPFPHQSMKHHFDRDATSSTSNEHDKTLLTEACIKGHNKIVIRLLEKGTNPNFADKNGKTPLMWACINGRFDIVASLLKHKANIDAQDGKGTTPLIWACINDHLDIVKHLIEEGAKHDNKDNIGRTALMWACAAGKYDVAEYLLDKGANPNNIDNIGATALTLAISGDHTTIVKLLVQKGANSTIGQRGMKPLALARINEQNEVVNMLSPEVDKLTDACRENDLEKVKLLSHNPNTINELDKLGWTALTIACHKNNLALVKLLVSKGAEIDKAGNQKDNERLAGRSPLMLACSNGNFDIASYLTDNKANVEAKDKRGWTPLMFAKNEAIANLLVENKANIEARDNDGNTPLVWACCTNNADLTKYFVSKKANIGIENKAGLTPMSLTKNKEIIELLRSKEAL